jgi:2-phospho-L-lactate guanylyltransferase
VCTWAIVPMKDLSHAKSGLRHSLLPDERTALVSALLRRTLRVLSEIPAIEGTLIASRDPDVHGIAHSFGAQPVTEPRGLTLNGALAEARREAVAKKATAVVIFPADLPLLDRDSVERVLEMAADPPALVVVPDRRGEGTNMLCVPPPPDLIDFGFGSDSCARHISSGKEVNACVRVQVSHKISSAGSARGP